MKINSRKVLPFLYLFPAILILGVFVYYPIIENIYNSFFDWSVFKPDRAFEMCIRDSPNGILKI